MKGTEVQTPSPNECTVTQCIDAHPNAVFDAVSTIDGLARWWTPTVTGEPIRGGTLTFSFPAVNETIEAAVTDVRPPSVVEWRFERHSAQPTWNGSRIRFSVDVDQAGQTALTATHSGVPADAVEGGWRHFLDSIKRLVETGTGNPFTA